jgi:hypothetical protein
VTLPTVIRVYCLLFVIGSTLADVKLELSLEELADAKRGVLPLHDVSPNTFLSVGFELEEQQYVLCIF